MTTRRKQIHGQTRRAVLAREPAEKVDGYVNPLEGYWERPFVNPQKPPADLKYTPPEPEPEFEPLPRVFLGRDGHDE